MYSKFKSIVESAVKEKGIKISSFQTDRIRAIERKLDDEKIKIEEAVKMLEAINDGFDYKFSNDDFSKIEKKLKGL